MTTNDDKHDDDTKKWQQTTTNTTTTQKNRTTNDDKHDDDTKKMTTNDDKHDDDTNDDETNDDERGGARTEKKGGGWRLLFIGPPPEVIGAWGCGTKFCFSALLCLFDFAFLFLIVFALCYVLWFLLPDFVYCVKCCAIGWTFFFSMCKLSGRAFAAATVRCRGRGYIALQSCKFRRQALRVTPCGKHWLTVYRAPQIRFSAGKNYLQFSHHWIKTMSWLNLQILIRVILNQKKSDSVTSVGSNDS